MMRLDPTTVILKEQKQVGASNSMYVMAKVPAGVEYDYTNGSHQVDS